ncbi:hypothetical protein HYPSUDRAFT_45428 [Hypholoma sublateritium FD-334 SS-4]|uniref:Uncharacterized protein n=1 Tax=Hypholoma sublateritium (strain FD-334 SS-4) TaxID=945553 RepID=A0A0D2NNE3_HYPSF|nr:hypothetical protein HYPSUDRAFT_45428 [Hypholoma sublateritium FD-334 SS-4]
MGIPRAPTAMLSRAAQLVMHRPLIPFLNEPWTLDSKSRWPAILLEVFLYGINVVTFALCTFILWRQKIFQRTPLIITSILFTLSSTDIIVTLYFFFRFVLDSGNVTSSATPNDGPQETWNKVLEVKFAVYVVANLVNSSILINRCHSMWKDRRIIIAPVGLISIGTVISFVSLGEAQLGDKLLAASFITSAAGNLFVTFLIATGMIWTSRKVRNIVKIDLNMVAGYATSLLIDSGAFYSSSIFLYLVFHSLVINASLTQIGCITTTAIILRNSHPREPLGTDNADFAATLTRPDMRAPEPVYSHSQRIGVPSSLGRPTEEVNYEDNLDVDNEYK